MNENNIKAKRQYVKVLAKILADSLKNGINDDNLSIMAREYLGACIEIYPSTVETPGELRIFAENCIYYMLQYYGGEISGDAVYNLHEQVMHIIMRNNGSGIYNPIDLLD